MIFASGSCGWVQSSFEPFFFRCRSRRARSARVGVSIPDAWRELPQEVLVAFPGVPPHDGPQRRVRLQRRRVNADRLPLDQARVGETLQHPRENRFVCLQIDQTTGAGNRRVVGRRLFQTDAQKIAQRQRVRRAPGDAALGVNALEIANQQQPEIDTRRQAGPAHHLGVEAGALAFGEVVESMFPQ